MAAISYFIIGPSLIISLIGLIKGPDKTKPTPAEDWHDAKVDVVIPAYNAASEIDLCLAALSRQTLKPRKIILFDDGSTDNTYQLAKEFSESIGLDVTIVRRDKSEGKTASLREAAQESEADVEFVLDSDTVLESDDYLARTVEELYKGVGIASVCGLVLPLTEYDRSTLLADPKVGPALRENFGKHREIGYYQSNKLWNRFSRFLTNAYRDVLYKFLEKVIYRGEQTFFGTMINPVGCAVAYRKKYIKAVFEDSIKSIGPDLTTSEDIYFGFAFSNEGYRNVQITDVKAKTLEPLFSRLPKQVFMWSSAFFQSNYLVSSLLQTPFKLFRKLRYKRVHAKEEEANAHKRKIKEAYRQSFGKKITENFGRPIGWFVAAAAIEKITFPLIILLMLIFRWWEALVITFLAESLVCALLLFFSCKGERLKMALKSILVAPIRYMVLFYDLFIFIWFIIEVWVVRDRDWRK
jgi:glycosyltransferase involved in cell wall biosynthesis